VSHADRAGLSEHRFSVDDQRHYEDALEGGDYLLCAKVPSGEDPSQIVRVLEDSSSTVRGPEGAAEMEHAPERQMGASGSASTIAKALFVGEAWIARGGAQVAYIAPEAAKPDVVRSSFEPPATRRFDDRELISAGLLQERTIEASEMNEVPVISRRAVIREEVVIRKTAEQQTEIVRDTVRRTEAEITELDPGTPGAGRALTGHR
jgi:hypothetical protein